MFRALPAWSISRARRTQDARNPAAAAPRQALGRGAPRRLDLPPHMQRRINLAMAAALVLVVALATGAAVVQARST